MEIPPELETRTCKCGCGRQWRCMPTSRNVYSSARHNPKYSWTGANEDSPYYAVNRARPGRPRKNATPAPIDPDEVSFEDDLFNE